MTPDIILKQPLIPTSTGYEQFCNEFRCLRTFIPDIKGKVTNWSWNGEFLYIELVLGGSLGRDKVEWSLIDRLKLDEQGYCSERISFFDPMPLLLRIVITPVCWFRLLRSGMLLLLLKSLRPSPLKTL